MTKVKPKTKEQLIYFLLTNLSLGTYDSKFLNNIQVSNVINKKPLTSNQAELLYKIIERYTKQLRKLDLNVLELLDLPWTLEPVPSLPEYTEAHLLLQDSQLVLRSPYKKEFVKDIGTTETLAKWHKETKEWLIPANTYSLKKIKECLENNYDKVNYCDKIKELIRKVETHRDCKYWNPTYTYINGNYYVTAINEALLSAIEHIPFNGELHTVAHLSRYGITIDDIVREKLYARYPVDDVCFATDFKVSTEVDDMDIVDKLKELKTDLILISKVLPTTSDYIQLIKNQMSPTVAWAHISEDETGWYNLLEKSNYPVVITTGMYVSSMSLMKTAGKVVHIVDTKPINIK